jgi:hypothetical protein
LRLDALVTFRYAKEARGTDGLQRPGHGRRQHLGQLIGFCTTTRAQELARVRRWVRGVVVEDNIGEIGSLPRAVLRRGTDLGDALPDVRREVEHRRAARATAGGAEDEPDAVRLEDVDAV